MLPYDTVSLCSTCYRHIPATVYAENGKVYLKKTCAEHGESTHIVENNYEFYQSLALTQRPGYEWNAILIEVTDKCNLSCPHCYHLPDNRSVDRSIESIIQQVKSFPNDDSTIILAGAEPTLRKDLVDLLAELEQMGRNVQLLTNGVKLADEDFVKDIAQFGVKVCIGLNHPDYQGMAVHRKQLAGITNCIKHKVGIEYIGYTCETAEQLDYILDEIQVLHKTTRMMRIRFGSDIGRAPDEPKRTLSDNFMLVKDHAMDKGYFVTDIGGDDNIYHKMIKVGDATVRLIQWPDVDNIVMDELTTGPWCHFYDGPITNFVHQVITRDAFKNNKQPMLDQCPVEFQYYYKDDRCDGKQ